MIPDERGPSLEAGRQLILAHRPELAERELRRWLAVYPESAHGHALLAWSLAMQDRADPAVQAAREAVRLDPEWSYTHIVLGEIHLHFRQNEDAERCARAALEADPGDVGGYAVLSAALLNQKWRFRGREALRAAEAGLAADPGDPACARLRAQALSRLMRHKAAREAAAYALTLGPELSENHAAAGWIALAAGDRAHSSELLRQALRLDPTNEDARKGLHAATYGARFSAALLVEAQRWKWLLCGVAAVYAAELASLAPRAGADDLVFIAGYSLFLLGFACGLMAWAHWRHPVVVQDIRLAGPGARDAKEARQLLVALVIMLLGLPYGLLME